MKLTCKQLVGGAALLTAMTAVQTAQATSPRSGGGRTEAVTQQSGTVRGTLTDTDGEPLVGASVTVKGQSGKGAITDIEGKFSLSGVSRGTTLVISYVGYKPREVKWDGQPLNISLNSDDQSLNEIVVVGYGTQKKANLSGSVAQVDAKALEERPIANVSSGLQGLMPGITVTGLNGAPGLDGGSIHIRGVGTLNTSTPYILVDGVETGTLNSIDPDEIASVSVLKDASSAAIYGSKASNGVILITTKRGQSGKAKVGYTGYFGIQNATDIVDRMSSADYAYWMNQARAREGLTPAYTDEQIQKYRDGSDPYNYPNTDWADLAFRTGWQQRHNINVSGGTENARYVASVGYLKQKGVLPNAGREQFNARTNLDVDLAKDVTMHLNLAYIHNDYSDASSAYYGGSSDQLLRQLNRISPMIVNQYEDGTYGTISDGNPIAWLDSGMKVWRKNQNLTAQLGFDYRIIDGLVFNATGSFVTNYQRYKYFQKFIQYNPNKASDPSQLTDSNADWHRTNFDATLNYTKSWLDAHNFHALAGWHAERYKYNYNTAYRKNFPNNLLTDMNAGDASTQTNGGYSRELTMVSWFGRINYDYKGRYLFEGNIRGDASSRFKKGHRWGYFPSFSAAWRISEEPFMASTKGWLSNLKLRASWGKLGNQDALSEYYPWMSTYSLGASYPFDGTLTPGYYQSNYRLESISWEKATTWGIGVDFGIFDGLTGSVDYYNRKTTGIIMQVSVPDEFALGGYYDNVGSMRNSGVEVQLNYQKSFGKDWSINIGANFAYNKNKILDLGGVAYMANGSARNAVGHQYGEFYAYKWSGKFFNSDEEANAYTEKYGNPFGSKFRAGDLIYEDTNGYQRDANGNIMTDPNTKEQLLTGKPDGKLDAADRIYTGKSDNPKYTYGFTVGASWKWFDIQTVWQGVEGVSHIYNREVVGEFAGDAGHPATVWKNSWTETNHDAEFPRVYRQGQSPSGIEKCTSTFWIWNTGYLRLKTLQFGYNVPKPFLSKIGLTKVRLYYSAENLITFDHLPFNIDPEATSERNSSYPLLRSHSFGINITF